VLYLFLPNPYLLCGSRVSQATQVVGEPGCSRILHENLDPLGEILIGSAVS
jgi:hypothetical protein